MQCVDINTCEYAEKCWRRAYSQYLLTRGYNAEKIPNRLQLLQAGVANIDMLGTAGDPRATRGIYAECFPLIDPSGNTINLCPAMDGSSQESCYEYQKEYRSRLRLERARSFFRVRMPNQARRKYIAKHVRRQIAQDCSYKCVYCHRAQNSFDGEGKKVTTVVDHFIPRAFSEACEDHSNLVLACRMCNQEKGSQLWERGCRVGYYDDR